MTGGAERQAEAADNGVQRRHGWAASPADSALLGDRSAGRAPTTGARASQDFNGSVGKRGGAKK